MCWQKIIFALYTLYLIAGSIATINKPREPIKPSVVAFTVVMWILLAAMVFSI